MANVNTPTKSPGQTYSSAELNTRTNWINTPLGSPTALSVVTGNVDIDCSSQKEYSDLAVTEDLTFNFTNLAVGNCIVFDIIVSGGPHTITLGTNTSKDFSGLSGTPLDDGTYQINGRVTSKGVDIAVPELGGGQVATPLDAVTLTSTTPADGAMQIDFTNPNLSRETANQVFYKLNTEPTVWTTGVQAATAATTVQQTGLTNGQLYDFKIVALGDGSVWSDSPDSNILSDTPAASFDADSVAIFNQMGVVGTEPDATRKGHIDTLVKGLKTDGEWDKLVSLYIFHAHGANERLVDWKNPTGNAATLVGTPGFTVDSEITLNGLDEAVDTGIVPSSDLTTNNHAVGTLVNGTFAATATITLFGCTMTSPSVSALKMNWVDSLTKYSGNIQDATTIDGASSTKELNTLYSTVRSASNARQLKINATNYENDTQASLDLPDMEISVGADNHETNGHQNFGNIGASAFYASTSNLDQAELKARIDTYLAAL